MPRRRDERGWVKKVGKTQRMWEGYFNVYVRLADGAEKRRRRSRILGPCGTMTKNEAMDELRKIHPEGAESRFGCGPSSRRSRVASGPDIRADMATISHFEGVQLVKCDPKSRRERV